jgi:hypothetical protein
MGFKRLGGSAEPGFAGRSHPREVASAHRGGYVPKDEPAEGSALRLGRQRVSPTLLTPAEAADVVRKSDEEEQQH